jgi:polyhydroxybutyrate depolymerase
MKQILLFFLLFNNLFFSQEKSFWKKNVEIQIGSTIRYFDVFVPFVLETNPKLVILLHGGTQCKEELFDSNAGATKYWKEVAEKNNFLLVVPNGTNLINGKTNGSDLNWNDCRKDEILKNKYQSNDVDFISKLIDWSSENYKINTQKVFATGTSNGGLMCFRLATELPQKITAIATFSANLFQENECISANLPIPVMIVNGTKDEFIPFNGGKTKFKNENVKSSQETIDYWIKNNNLSKDDVLKTDIPQTINDDDSTIKKYVFGNLKSQKQVVYYIIEGGGHTMPGQKHVLSKFKQRIVGKQNQDVEGAQIAWDFFSKL